MARAALGMDHRCTLGLSGGHRAAAHVPASAAAFLPPRDGYRGSCCYGRVLRSLVAPFVSPVLACRSTFTTAWPRLSGLENGQNLVFLLYIGILAAIRRASCSSMLRCLVPRAPS